MRFAFGLVPFVWMLGSCSLDAEQHDQRFVGDWVVYEFRNAEGVSHFQFNDDGSLVHVKSVVNNRKALRGDALLERIGDRVIPTR